MSSGRITLELTSLIKDDLNFLDIHPLEVARQMTLAEFSVPSLAPSVLILEQTHSREWSQLFTKIKPVELLHTSWTKGQSPNVQALTDRFNKVIGIRLNPVAFGFDFLRTTGMLLGSHRNYNDRGPCPQSRSSFSLHSSGFGTSLLPIDCISLLTWISVTSI